MKLRRVYAIFAVISAFSQVRGAGKEAPAVLEVHEWGTFTTLSGSDGTPVAWYLHQLAEVPRFVETSTARAARLGLKFPALAGKTGTTQWSNGLTKTGAGALTLNGFPPGVSTDSFIGVVTPSVLGEPADKTGAALSGKMTPTKTGTLTLKSAPPVASTESLTRTGTAFSTPDHSNKDGSELEKLEGGVGQNPGNPGNGQTVSIIPARIRMETPVIYFYAQKPLSVWVGVHFEEGTLTEYFPPPTSSQILGETVWQGDLLPPTDPDIARLLPDTRGEAGENYGEARHVPEAWYFHVSPPSAKPGREWEKFIFYRGSGALVPPLVAQATGPHTVQFRPSDSQPVSTWAFALQVEGNRARWKALPPLQQTATDPTPAGVTVELVQEEPLDQADAELSAAVTQKLIASGLTPSEAAAMVATWRAFWFREPGTRIVGLIPRAWVDQGLPLHIEPAPQKMERIFVGRWELITPDQEQVLAHMLASDDPMISGADMENIHAWHLGRFTEGAWARVLELTKGDKVSEFSAIRRQALEAALHAEAAPPKAVSQR